MLRLKKSQIFTKGVPWVVYTAYTVTVTLVSLPAYMAYLSIRSCRPNPNWTFKQAVTNHLTRTVFNYLAVVELPTAQIKSTKSGDFVMLKPGDNKVYQDLLSNPEIQPVSVGAVWVPSMPSTPLRSDQFITLHIHGGAFVTLSPGMSNVQNGPRLLANELGTSVLMVDYRLSCNAKSQFPAALQDVVTAYRNLLELGYSSRQIILSGDSAGANLVLALLRYISEHKELQSLPCPTGAALWSPWTDLTLTDEALYKHPNSSTDHLTMNLLTWGVRDYVPKDESPSGPYFSPGKHPFATEACLFIHNGTSEVMADQQHETAVAYASIKGNQVELNTTPNAMHDIFAAGGDMGFPEAQVEIIKAAHRFFLDRKG